MRHPMSGIQEAIEMAHTHKHEQLGHAHQLGTMGACDWWDFDCHMAELRRSLKDDLVSFGFSAEDIDKAYADIGEHLEGKSKEEAAKIMKDYLSSGGSSSQAPPTAPSINIADIVEGPAIAGIERKYLLYGGAAMAGIMVLALILRR